MSEREGLYAAVVLGAVALLGWLWTGITVLTEATSDDRAWVTNLALGATAAAIGCWLLSGPFTARIPKWSTDIDRAFKQFEYERDRVQALGKGVAGTAAGVLTTLLAAGLTSSATIDAPTATVIGVVVLAVSLILMGLYANLSVQQLSRRLR